MLHGALSYLMQDSGGQVLATHSISAGLDYPGVGPEHSALRDSGRVEYVSATDSEALAAFHELCLLEGIIPALESSHALHVAARLAHGAACRRGGARLPQRPWGQGCRHRARVRSRMSIRPPETRFTTAFATQSARSAAGAHPIFHRRVSPARQPRCAVDSARSAPDASPPRSAFRSAIRSLTGPPSSAPARSPWATG